MSKQRRIKKLVKGHLNSVDAEGTPLFADEAAKLERLLQMKGKSTANPGKNLTDVQLSAVLLDQDADSVDIPLDAFPLDARESADADRDGTGNNKEIHDAALLILAEHTAGATLFASIETQAGNGAGQVAALLTTAEGVPVPANHAADAGAYQTAYDNANAALIALNADILAFEQHAATANTLFDSIKDLTATANVKYETTPGNANTAKLVTDSATEARRHQADFTNNTPELVAANDPDFANLALMDIVTEKAKVTTAVTGFTARLDALTDPATIPAA